MACPTIQRPVSAPASHTRPKSPCHRQGQTFDIIVFGSPARPEFVGACVDSFRFRQKEDVTETIGNSQDNSRLQVPREYVVATIRVMEKAVSGCICDSVFRFENREVSESKDHKSKEVVVPIAIRWVVRQFIMGSTET
jgi:hypothetical protein